MGFWNHYDIGVAEFCSWCLLSIGWCPGELISKGFLPHLLSFQFHYLRTRVFEITLMLFCGLEEFGDTQYWGERPNVPAMSSIVVIWKSEVDEFAKFRLCVDGSWYIRSRSVILGCFYLCNFAPCINYARLHNQRFRKLIGGNSSSTPRSFVFQQMHDVRLGFNI